MRSAKDCSQHIKKNQAFYAGKDAALTKVVWGSEKVRPVYPVVLSGAKNKKMVYFSFFQPLLYYFFLH